MQFELQPNIDMLFGMQIKAAGVSITHFKQLINSVVWTLSMKLFGLAGS